MGVAHVSVVVVTIFFALTIVGGIAPRLIDMVEQWRAALILTGYCPPILPVS